MPVSSPNAAALGGAVQAIRAERSISQVEHPALAGRRPGYEDSPKRLACSSWMRRQTGVEFDLRPSLSVRPCSSLGRLLRSVLLGCARAASHPPADARVALGVNGATSAIAVPGT